VRIRRHRARPAPEFSSASRASGRKRIRGPGTDDRSGDHRNTSCSSPCNGSPYQSGHRGAPRGRGDRPIAVSRPEDVHPLQEPPDLGSLSPAALAIHTAAPPSPRRRLSAPATPGRRRGRPFWQPTCSSRRKPAVKCRVQPCAAAGRGPDGRRS